MGFGNSLKVDYLAFSNNPNCPVVKEAQWWGTYAELLRNVSVVQPFIVYGEAEEKHLGVKVMVPLEIGVWLFEISKGENLTES